MRYIFLRCGNSNSLRDFIRSLTIKHISSLNISRSCYCSGDVLVQTSPQPLLFINPKSLKCSGGNCTQFFPSNWPFSASSIKKCLRSPGRQLTGYHMQSKILLDDFLPTHAHRKQLDMNWHLYIKRVWNVLVGASA